MMKQKAPCPSMEDTESLKQVAWEQTDTPEMEWKPSSLPKHSRVVDKFVFPITQANLEKNDAALDI